MASVFLNEYDRNVQRHRTFKLQYLFKDINFVFLQASDIDKAVVFQLYGPPRVYALREHSDAPWERSVDYTPENALGSCGVHRFVIAATTPAAHVHQLIKSFAPFAHSHKIDLRPLDIKHDSAAFLGLAKLLDQISTGPSTQSWADAHVLTRSKKIPFAVMFLVYSLVHSWSVSVHNLDDRFYELLRETKENVAITALQEILADTRREGEALFYPTNTLSAKLRNIQSRPREVPLLLASAAANGQVWVRRVNVTPTRVLCAGMELDFSNRVLRQYEKPGISDRFLRVAFTEDDHQRLPLGVLRDKADVYERVKEIVQRGLTIGNRHYEFLASSTNQLRQHSAWFFASDAKLTAQGIWDAMSKDFRNQSNVAKCAARMGQCFSSTTRICEIPRSEVQHLEDVTRNGFAFSDGAGWLSQDLVDRIVAKLHPRSLRPKPSAFQIRFRGYKGVVSLKPTATSILGLRPSMKKFDSDVPDFEVIQSADFWPGFLNRQIILLLSAAGIPDSVFQELQNQVVARLDGMFTIPEVALNVLLQTCGGRVRTILVEAIRAGFSLTEPFIEAILKAFRAAQLVELQTKARIFVPHGARLMGGIDETGKLQYGQVFINPMNYAAASQGMKPGDPFPKPTPVTGLIAVTKNPCFHPGDVRTLEAVDIPELHHRVNEIVFPQQGPRPHPDEVSGSDLDGDVYTVLWHRQLIPPVDARNLPAMDYKSPPEKTLDYPARLDDIQDFFLEYMQNDSLGQIANAHLAISDYANLGVLDRRCIELARLHSVSVDYPKTGVPAELIEGLRPERYPDFMEKPKHIKSYESKKVLGNLFRAAKGKRERVLEDEREHAGPPALLPFDQDMLYPGWDDFICEARRLYEAYRSNIHSLMQQFGIEDEADLVSGTLLNLGEGSHKRRMGHVKERIRLAVGQIFRDVRSYFGAALVPDDADEGLLSGEVRQYSSVDKAKASAWYCTTYHPVYQEVGQQRLLSFPWLAHEILCAIKRERVEERKRTG
eukprot:jgi/Chlat1/3847/Chrsp26S03977